MIGITLVLTLGACPQLKPHVSVSSSSAAPAATVSPTPTAIHAIPWISTPPPRPPLTLSERGVPRCLASNLAGRFVGVGAAAGNDLNVMAIANIGRVACYVKGRPHIQVVTTTGESFPWSSGTTYFPDSGAVEILMNPGTRLPGSDEETKMGQARLGFTYFDCDLNDKIASVIVQFNADRFVISVRGQDLAPTGLPACNGTTTRTGPVQTSVNNFEPPVIPPSPYQSAMLSITAPATVKAGSLLRYSISVSDAVSVDLEFPTPCPGYEESLGNSRMSATATFELNCARVDIAAGNYQDFEMQFRVPSTFRGRMTLSWSFLPSTQDRPAPTAPILVTN